MLRALIISTLALMLLGCGVSQEELDAALDRLEARNVASEKKLVDLTLTIDSKNVEVLDDVQEHMDSVRKSMAASEMTTYAAMRQMIEAEKSDLVASNNETVAVVDRFQDRITTNIQGVYDAMDGLKERNTKREADLLSAVQGIVRESELKPKTI